MRPAVMRAVLCFYLGRLRRVGELTGFGRRRLTVGWARSTGLVFTTTPPRLTMKARPALRLLASDEPRLLGHCELCQIDHYKRIAQADLRELQLAAGQAVTTATLVFLVEQAFGPMDLSRVEATCDVGDKESGAVFAAAGLRYEGTLRDHFDCRGERGDHELWAVAADPGHPAKRKSPLGRGLASAEQTR